MLAASVEESSQPIANRMREYFLQEVARQRIEALAPERRAAVHRLAGAARIRLAVARDIAATRKLPAVVTLYREATLLLARAFVAAAGADGATHDTDVAILSSLEVALRGAAIAPPDAYGRARPLLASSHPLDADRLPRDELRRRTEDLDATARWLSRLVDARSGRAVARARLVRPMIAVATALLLAGAAAAWALAPANVAAGKTVTASPAILSTAPEGVVDGWRNGHLGFHSALQQDPWLSVDLGAPHRLSKVTVYGRTDCCFDQSIPLVLEISDDGRAFRGVGKMTRAFNDADPWIVPLPSERARFVRLRREGHGYLVIGEVVVAGTPD